MTDGNILDEFNLRSGEHVMLRFIRADDAGALRAAFARLSPLSRYQRFLAQPRELSDEVVRYLTQVDGTNHVAIVATVASHDMKTEHGIGVARFIRVEGEPHVAEAAVTVIDAYQGQGIGRRLLRALAAAARDRDITTFRATILVSNAPMLSILGGVESRRATADGTFEVNVSLPQEAPDPKHPLRQLLRAAAESLAALRRLGGE